MKNSVFYTLTVAVLTFALSLGNYFWNTTGTAENPIKVWKTIKLGTLKTGKQFIEAIESQGMGVSYLSRAYLGKPDFPVAPKEMEIRLVIKSVSEFGFEYGATLGDICLRAKERGLSLCPAEVGPQLRLQYTNQPEDEELIVAMAPLASEGEYLGMFGLIYAQCKKFFLWGGFDGHPKSFYRNKDIFVFALQN